MSIEQVQEFHKKFDLPLGDENVMTRQAFEFRMKFLEEELSEFKSAMLMGESVLAFDALLDLVYVVHGTALFMGISPDQWNQGMAEVQRCNMAKIRAESAGQSKRGSAFDVVKPEGWTGPEQVLGEILNG